MESFVNRVPELRLIEVALGDLLSQERRLLRTPIIDFYGVGGIGKSSILTKAVQRCNEHKVPCIRVNVSQNLFEFTQQVHEQAKEQAKQLLSPQRENDTFEYSINLSHALLKQGPLVLLLDAVDSANANQFERIKQILSELTEHNTLFVVLASRRSISFEHEKNVARKLTIVPLLSFDREASDLYIEETTPQLTPKIRNLVFEWTRGYPLAMNVMVKAVTQQGMNPGTKNGKMKLINQIVQQVIITRLLANVPDHEKSWFHTILSLLAVPRRFNLITMQKLIEQFAPDFKLDNSLAYIVIPKRITQATGALSWNLSKAGFAIDEPVRNILLLQLKINNEKKYYEINNTLAEMNRLNAIDVSESDRIHYQREYLYHSANSTDTQNLSRILEATVAQIIQDSENSPNQLIQFHEEFQQDDELKACLGAYMTIVSGHINKKLAQIMLESALKENDQEKRYRYLHDYFYYIILDPTIHDLSIVLKERARQLQTLENTMFFKRLFEELRQDESVRKAGEAPLAALTAYINDDNMYHLEDGSPC